MFSLRTAKIFYYFLWHDFYTFKSRVWNYLINNCFIYPVLYSLLFGFLLPTVFFGAENYTQGTTLFIGHMLIISLVFANIINSLLLFDLESTRFTYYQITLLPPRVFIVQRIIFTGLLTFLISAPFFPVAKLILGPRFVTDQTSWFFTYLILFLGSLCCSAYTMWAACWIPNTRKLRAFWMQFNFPLITFGGLFIPWFVVNKLNSTLGSIILANHLLYYTEGLRSAVLNSRDFISVGVCITALSFFTVFFTLLSFYFFKKKVDHI